MCKPIRMGEVKCRRCAQHHVAVYSHVNERVTFYVTSCLNFLDYYDDSLIMPLSSVIQPTPETLALR